MLTVLKQYSPNVMLQPLDDALIAAQLRAMRSEMSILKMERLSGVSRQVLYRIMGGSSVNRSPYELAVKVIAFIEIHGSRQFEPQATTVTVGTMSTRVKI